VLGTVIKETNGLFDRRFLVNALLPTLVLIGLLGVVTIVPTIGARAALITWNRQDTLIKALYSLAVILVAVLLAACLAGSTASLVRLFEGYWTTPAGRFLARAGRRWHQSRLATLDPEDGADYQLIHANYPTSAQEVMPTRIGNILKNAELHPEERYGIDAVLIWPRLHPLLPADHRAALAAARSDLEFFLTLAALAAFFSLSCAGFLVLARAGAGLFLLCHCGGAAVALLSYLGALAPARRYAQQVKVTFDVYRAELLAVLGHQGTHEDDEPRLWDALAKQWYRGVPVATTLQAPPSPPPPEPPPAAERRALPLSAWAAIVVVLTGVAGALFS
jgi:hypothetical protein